MTFAQMWASSMVGLLALDQLWFWLWRRYWWWPW